LLFLTQTDFFDKNQSKQVVTIDLTQKYLKARIDSPTSNKPTRFGKSNEYPLAEAKINSLARAAHALSYGWYSHDLQFYFGDPQHSRSIE